MNDLVNGMIDAAIVLVAVSLFFYLFGVFL
jgi:hypothetical protein